MKKYSVYLIPLLFFMPAGISGCEKESQEEVEFFHVEVLGVGLDCGNLYLVEFLDDEEKVNKHSTLTNAYFPVYYAQNLKEEYKVGGLKLRITLGSAEDIIPVLCTCMGPGYGHIYIENSEIESDQE